MRRSSAILGLLAVGGLVAGLGARSSVRATPLPAPALDAKLGTAKGEQMIVFAGGCFWGVDAVFARVKSVKSTTSGYAGGTTKSPSYEEVSSGETGHAESVRVVFDSSEVSLGQLLHVFFSVAHDPTQLNYQGPDHGTQYRSAIFYSTKEQKPIIDAYIAQLTAAKAFPRPIVTQLAPLT